MDSVLNTFFRDFNADVQSFLPSYTEFVVHASRTYTGPAQACIRSGESRPGGKLSFSDAHKD